MPGRRCRICISPLRPEIEFLISNKASKMDIVRKYHKAFNSPEQTFYVSVTRHIKKKHPPAIDMTPVTEQRAIEPKDFKAYAAKLLQAGFSNLDTTKVSPSHVISAQRALIEEEKVKGTLDNQRLLLMRFMRGKASLNDIREAEVIDGTTGLKTLPSNSD